MIKEKILCIHHLDADGKLAGAIVKREHPEAELIEVDYKDYKKKLKFILEADKPLEYDTIFILDFSLEKADMEKLIKSYKLIWCDHHKSSIEKLGEIWNDKTIEGKRSTDMCGAMLTWHYFGHKRDFEELKLVDDYDRWIHKLGEKTHWFAEVNDNWDIEKWVEVIAGSGTGFGTASLDSYLAQGKQLFELKLKRIEKTIKKGRPITFHGRKAFLVNNTITMDGALLGSQVCKNGYEVAIKFEFNNDIVLFGLNSIGDIDVSVIAKTYGGGGHKNASGFHLPIKEAFKILNEGLE